MTKNPGAALLVNIRDLTILSANFMDKKSAKSYLYRKYGAANVHWSNNLAVVVTEPGLCYQYIQLDPYLPYYENHVIPLIIEPS